MIFRNSVVPASTMGMETGAHGLAKVSVKRFWWVNVIACLPDLGIRRILKNVIKNSQKKFTKRSLLILV